MGSYSDEIRQERRILREILTKIRKALSFSVHQFTATFKKPDKKIRQIV